MNNCSGSLRVDTIDKNCSWLIPVVGLLTGDDILLCGGGYGTNTDIPWSKPILNMTSRREIPGTTGLGSCSLLDCLRPAKLKLMAWFTFAGVAGQNTGMRDLRGPAQNLFSLSIYLYFSPRVFPHGGHLVEGLGISLAPNHEGKCLGVSVGVHSYTLNPYLW